MTDASEIWRPEERQSEQGWPPSGLAQPTREDIWGETASPQARMFVLPLNWRASIPRRRRRGLWLGLASLATIGIVAALLIIR